MSYGGYNNGSAGYGQQGGGNRYNQQAGNPYAQQGGNQYAQQGGNQYAQQEQPGAYGQQEENPFAQQQAGNPYGQQQQQQQQQQGGRYNQPAANSYDHQQGGGYANGNEMEMGQMNGGAAPAREDPHAVLNECRDIDRGIESIQRNLERLQYLQGQSLDDPDASQNTRTNRELDNLSTETMNLYRNFAARVKKLKGMPGAGSAQNSAQVGRVDRKLKETIQQYQTVDADFRKKLQAQMARQYRIVRPDASEAEVREACEDTSSTQVFSQALLQSDRRGQSQSALRAVQGRHEAIQKIERQVIELAQLFEDMNALVVQQEPVVARINEQSENVTQDVTNANLQLDGAIEKAKSRNRKKWWCLGIGILIVIIIVVLVVLFVGVHIGQPKSTSTN